MDIEGKSKVTPPPSATSRQTAVTFIRGTTSRGTVDVALAWTSRTNRIDTTDLLEQFTTDDPDPALIARVMSVAREIPGRAVRGDPDLDEQVCLLEARCTGAPNETAEIVWRPRLMHPMALPEDDERRAIVRWRLEGWANPSSGELSVPRPSPCELVEAFRVGCERRYSTARLQFRAELRGGGLTISWGTAAGIGAVEELLGLRRTRTPWERVGRAAYGSQLTLPGRQWTAQALAGAAGVDPKGIPTQQLDALFPGLLLPG